MGVVGAVVPWNFPVQMAMWKLAPALATGCTMVLKPSELTSLSALKLAEYATQAGIPAGVLNVVPGMGEEVGAALGLHNDVSVLAFTGSVEVLHHSLCRAHFNSYHYRFLRHSNRAFRWAVIS